VETRLAFNLVILSEKNFINFVARDPEDEAVGSIERAERWRMAFKEDQSFFGLHAELSMRFL